MSCLARRILRIRYYRHDECPFIDFRSIKIFRILRPKSILFSKWNCFIFRIGLSQYVKICWPFDASYSHSNLLLQEGHDCVYSGPPACENHNILRGNPRSVPFIVVIYNRRSQFRVAPSLGVESVFPGDPNLIRQGRAIEHLQLPCQRESLRPWMCALSSHKAAK